jgi:membrane-associated PAP2 superfamily phosphatase
MDSERLLTTPVLVRICLGLAAAALALAWLGARTDIDLALADAMFDGVHGFAWRDAWFATTFCHDIVKALLTCAALLLLLVVGWDGVRPMAWRDGMRLRLRVLALSAIAVPLVISLLKQASTSHCPWDLVRYGGAYAYVRLLGDLPSGTPAGHCLPAGHASSAFWLVALAVFWLPQRPRKAAAVACMALVFGFALGWVQQLRGAHFLTHTLWSAWLACALVTLMMACAGRVRVMRRQGSGFSPG